MIIVVTGEATTKERMSVKFWLENHSGYDSRDLRRFFSRGLTAMRIQSRKRFKITVTASPIRSRGCAEVNGTDISIAIGAPNRLRIKRLARLFEHEVAHSIGLEHNEMPHHVLYSLGKTPHWARGITLRYKHRAPDQMGRLGQESAKPTPRGGWGRAPRLRKHLLLR